MSMPNLNATSYGRLIDLTNQESYKFDWNPAEFTEEVAASYARQQVPGLSHRRSQFINTENRVIGFTLVVDGLAHGGPMAVERVRNFLTSTMYPRASRRVEGAGAPKMLLILPGTFKDKGFIDSVSFTHKLFYRDMKLRRFEAVVKFTEEPDQRITSQDVRRRNLSSRETGRFMDFRNHPPFSTNRVIDFSNSPPFGTRRR